MARHATQIIYILRELASLNYLPFSALMQFLKQSCVKGRAGIINNPKF